MQEEGGIGRFPCLMCPACQVISYLTSGHFTEVLTLTYVNGTRENGECQALNRFLALSGNNSSEIYLNFAQRYKFLGKDTLTKTFSPPRDFISLKDVCIEEVSHLKIVIEKKT